jgi:hypothetical protein
MLAATSTSSSGVGRGRIIIPTTDKTTQARSMSADVCFNIHET